MLEGLLGSKSAVKILLFLFVNERGYGSQMQNLLETPLTPLQKTLQRLEADGVLTSFYQGKLRIYEINPNYPFRQELENLLKKAYYLLPSQEKKQYCFIHKPRGSFQEDLVRERDKRKELEFFWKVLASIKNLAFSVKSRQNPESFFKKGKAEVSISAPNPSTFIFQEKGYWLQEHEPSTAFNSSFRWTLDKQNNLITLEHLRYGIDRPVFLFHLTPKEREPYILEAVDAHLCAADTYLGNIVWSAKSIDFHWRIIGPLKNEELMYHYT